MKIIPMSKNMLIKEHKKLINVLRSGDTKKQLKEAKEQAHELKNIYKYKK